MGRLDELRADGWVHDPGEILEAGQYLTPLLVVYGAGYHLARRVGSLPGNYVPGLPEDLLGERHQVFGRYRGGQCCLRARPEARSSGGRGLSALP